MTEWKAKRFWTTASVVPVPGGFTVQLDGRAVRTPAKAALEVPTEALAEAIAEEWQAQGKTVDPASMPCTRSANAAIDKVRPQFDDVAEMIACYGDTDLLCYRAEGPEALVARQSEAWDPLLEWARHSFAAPLRVTTGVIHVEQPAASLAGLRAQVFALTPFELTAFHDLVSISGSLVIGLAAIHGKEHAEALWKASRIDEDWQRELWGRDEEAEKFEAEKRLSFLHSERFFTLCRTRS